MEKLNRALQAERAELMRKQKEVDAAAAAATVAVEKGKKE